MSSDPLLSWHVTVSAASARPSPVRSPIVTFDGWKVALGQSVAGAAVTSVSTGVKVTVPSGHVSRTREDRLIVALDQSTVCIGSGDTVVGAVGVGEPRTGGGS